MSWHVTLNRKVKCVVDYTVLDAMLTIRFCWKIPFLNIFRRTFNGNVMLSNAYRFSVANAQKELHQMAVTEAIIGFICNRVLNIHLLQYWLLVKQEFLGPIFSIASNKISFIALQRPRHIYLLPTSQFICAEVY